MRAGRFPLRLSLGRGFAWPPSLTCLWPRVRYLVVESCGDPLQLFALARAIKFRPTRLPPSRCNNGRDRIGEVKCVARGCINLLRAIIFALFDADQIDGFQLPRFAQIFFALALYGLG